MFACARTHGERADAKRRRACNVVQCCVAKRTGRPGWGPSPMVVDGAGLVAGTGHQPHHRVSRAEST
eukprot:6505012-Prymnesium_polylepis.2